MMNRVVKQRQLIKETELPVTRSNSGEIPGHIRYLHNLPDLE